VRQIADAEHAQELRCPRVLVAFGKVGQDDFADLRIKQCRINGQGCRVPLAEDGHGARHSVAPQQRDTRQQVVDLPFGQRLAQQRINAAERPQVARADRGDARIANLDAGGR